ncbi:uncharacterized protein C19orf47 [Nilaparvata lugens]|uniref:uncharacterized protein C19orf47 n=1 Tax=Nilaparvata lugens TaxID=108931 RepID=UPI00193E9DC5|nr:uncharacterized protein C19orf47 [Nilaparvata lugens]
MSSKSVTRLSSIPDSREWKSFFIDAGIPSAESATYALTFAQNRIQSDMLVNINKDYLQEMGIKLIGDIIAILRHSRRVHDEIQRRTIMKSGASTPETQSVVSQSKVMSNPPTVQGKKVEPKVIKVEKYNDSEDEEEEEEEEEEEDEDDYTEDEEMEEEVVAKKALKSQTALVKKKQLSVISQAVSRPIVAPRPIQKVVKRIPAVPVEPQMTVRVTEKPTTMLSKKTSVFTRLGDRVESTSQQKVVIQQKVTMKSLNPVEPQKPHSSNASTSLPYVGILKHKRPASTPIVSSATKKISTMRADEEQKRPTERPINERISSRKPNEFKVQKLNVKDRLGSVSQVNEKPIQVKTLGSTTPRIPIVYNSEVSSSKKVSFGPVQKKEFHSMALRTGRFNNSWGNS